MIENKIFMGIDVSKETLDISLNQTHYKILNKDKNIKDFIDKHEGLLKEIRLCALEATGRYELKVMRMLQSQNVSVHRANPLNVKNFVRASNQKAKTDKIDALLLEQYAVFVKDKENGDPFMTDAQEMLQQMRTVERALENEIHGHKCRLEHLSKTARKIIKQHIKSSEKQRSATRLEIDRIIEADPVLSKKKKAMMEVRGIGKKIANTLICDMPELGTMTKKQVASLLGVAPFTKQSGKSRIKSHIRGGRFYARKALYMGALVCMKCCPKLRAFYTNSRMLGNVKSGPCGFNEKDDCND